MAELPAGTITMLFSDVEGPTALLARLGDGYPEAMSAQRALQRAAFSAHGGYELETQGDGCFVVFRSAANAIRSCADAQRALADHSWPNGVVVRVRMGLHSGEPVRHEDGYIGADVHRAARIAGTAHGGQVVLSDATRLLVETQLPAGTQLIDLGWHRLKDIEAPERIYQLTVAGLQERFPPLKSLGAQTSLPQPMTPLVGRDDDLDLVRAIVAKPGVRLVTLTGAGGVGKTRLALAAASALASDFPHGVFFVGLAAARDAEVMWKTIVADLNADGDGPTADVATRYLAERRALLVLDNLEQLDGASNVVATLLDAAPRLVVLATSRRPLHLQGEHEHPVPPLAVPRDAGVPAVTASGAAQLFVQHADMVRPGFVVTSANAGDIAEICQRLDGLPLAIELAASRVRLLTPSALLVRLGDSLDFSATETGRPSRHQTLRSTIAWSYELLTPDLASVFRRLGVFAGGCDLDALAAVAVANDGISAAPDADPLELAAGLLDVSLITVTETAEGEPRLGMLETVRDYALERLARAGELDETQGRHAAYFAGFAERARALWGGPAFPAALRSLETEHGNLRAALAWSLDPRDAGPDQGGQRVTTGLRLTQALTMFWYQHGHASEGRRWLERAVELAGDDAGAPLARVTHGLGILLRQQGEYDAAFRVLGRSLAIAREIGDLDRQARVLNTLGIAHHYLGHLDVARSLFEDSTAISRKLGDEVLVAMRLVNLGNVEVDAANLDRATEVLEEALALHRRRADPLGAANALLSLSAASLRAGRASDALAELTSALGDVVGFGDPELLAEALEQSSSVAAELGPRLRAARLAGAAEAIRQKAGFPIPEPNLARLERFLAPARATMPREVWDGELEAGRTLNRDQAVALLVSPAS
jgi:predicted ATPase/class 3 adenylate cyclase